MALALFVERLAAAAKSCRSLLCVGLDPDPALMPVPDVFEFNKAIVDATGDLTCAYKPNLSFYEALGSRGLEDLERTIAYIRSSAPQAIVVGDGKRGDIGSSSAAYARALFEVWGFDAATVNGYAGREAIEPFLEYRDRGVFVWCRSSNPGAREFQDLELTSEGRTAPLYEWVAERASGWGVHGNVGLVVGATYPEELQAIRGLCPGIPILVPGVGTQGGDLERSVRSGLDPGSRHNVLVNAPRSIIYASGGGNDFAEAARGAAVELRDRINRVLENEGRGW